MSYALMKIQGEYHGPHSLLRKAHGMLIMETGSLREAQFCVKVHKRFNY